jgi:hypothetical protein
MFAADPSATPLPSEPPFAESGPPGYSRQKNFLLNLPSYLKCRLPAAWAGSLRDFPACVCGTGFSGGTAAALLPLDTDGVLVFAPDVALQSLAHLGVQVDFAISTHPLREPAEFVAEELPPIFVVLGADSPPTWRDCVPADRVVYLSGTHPAERWLETRGVLPTAVSAANTDPGIIGLELARYLGCAPVARVGFGPAASSPGEPTPAHPALRKRTALARLVPAPARDLDATRAIRAELGAFGARGWGVLPLLTGASVRDLPDSAANALHSLLASDAATAALGTALAEYAAQAGDSLAPDRAGELLQQLEQLCSLAEGLYDDPAD